MFLHNQIKTTNELMVTLGHARSQKFAMGVVPGLMAKEQQKRIHLDLKRFLHRSSGEDKKGLHLKLERFFFVRIHMMAKKINEKGLHLIP